VFFRQILNEDLSCASYMIADSGEAAVVDPKWEIEDYLRIAEENNSRVSHNLETHNHADHLSGRGRLKEATGAMLYISTDASVEYEHQALSDGDVVEVGSVRLIAVATPGHRPEHTCFLVEDTSRTEQPWLLLTGDSLFVGDLARSDLAVDPEEGGGCPWPLRVSGYAARARRLRGGEARAYRWVSLRRSQHEPEA
jgi:hydroxyacylglutathione hydrolase